MSFQKGNLVKIRPEWGGTSNLYKVIEWNIDRGYIQPFAWKGPIVPTELVRGYMIDLVSENIDLSSS